MESVAVPCLFATYTPLADRVPPNITPTYGCSFNNHERGHIHLWVLSFLPVPSIVCTVARPVWGPIFSTVYTPFKLLPVLVQGFLMRFNTLQKLSIVLGETLFLSSLYRVTVYVSGNKY